MDYVHLLPKEKDIFVQTLTPSTPLAWEPSVRIQNTEISQFSKSPHKWFNTALRLANVSDLDHIEVPGAIIMLPWGMQLIERFGSLVREASYENEYQEYSYPALIPKNYLHPMKELFDVEESVLHIKAAVGSDASALILAPTGEYPIYHHWRESIKTKQDLPKKMFQCSKYFRPISSAQRSGGSLFISMEASDVFEFHACFETHPAASLEALKLSNMLKQIAQSVGTFLLWSLRPTWTNKGMLYQYSFGGDALLPSQHSVQVASTYLQGDVFSKRFNIRFKEQNLPQFTSQTTGAISRRCVFANLFQSIKADGSLTLHPHLAPIQLVFLLISYTHDDEIMAKNILHELKEIGIRLKFILIKRKSDIKKEEKIWYYSGIPLLLHVFGRTDFKELKMVLTRNDNYFKIKNVPLEHIKKFIVLALQEIAVHAQNRLLTLQKNILPSYSIAELEHAVQNRLVAAIPLSMQQAAVINIEKQHLGEVLGFYLSDTKDRCISSGEMTQTKAFFSRRI